MADGNNRASRSADQPDPFILVVFGASGDLTQRKLVPAIFQLACRDLLPEGSAILGFARSPKSDQGFRDELKDTVLAELSCQGQSVTAKQWKQFAKRIFYQQGQYDDPVSYAALRDRIDQLAWQEPGTGNCLFYLATPPDAFPLVAEQLLRAGLSRKGQGDPWSRIIVEKPFGHDLPTARALNAQLLAAFDEEQIFRIDHYLGKETVQNILAFRLSNSIFEHLWNHHGIDHVQITVSESLGVGGRGGYYDRAGAIRDMVQNHMMHLLALVAMEPPIALTADAIRNEKIKVFRALRPIPPECATNGLVRAQYTAGTTDGDPMVGYRQTKQVDPQSTTETFVAFKAFIDNWRWSDVPFYLRTGKALPTRCTEISVHFKSVPRVLFNRPPAAPLSPNVLTFRVQPDEGISLEFQAKVPGPGMQIRPLEMDFAYADVFDAGPRDAYERLLLDAAIGDATLFTRSDEVEAAWEYVMPVLIGCADEGPDGVLTYPAGTWGPGEADDLITADGRRWHLH